MRKLALAAAVLMLGSSGFAKDKNKVILPAYVLRARTVAVLIDPDAGVSVDDPRANEIAQKDVETALLNWGRFQLVIATETADLIIVVRKGHGKMVSPTISNPRQNGRAGTVDPYDSGVVIGGQHGHPPNSPDSSDASQSGSTQDGPHPQVEVGTANDSFAVYDGGRKDPLDAAPAWRFTAKDALRSHSVPAVDEFKKVLVQAEKAEADASHKP